MLQTFWTGWTFKREKNLHFFFTNKKQKTNQAKKEKKEKRKHEKNKYQHT